MVKIEINNRVTGRSPELPRVVDLARDVMQSRQLPEEVLGESQPRPIGEQVISLSRMSVYPPGGANLAQIREARQRVAASFDPERPLNN